jgi:hypothetical protein
MKEKRLICESCFRIESVSTCVKSYSCRNCGDWMKDIIQPKLDLWGVKKNRKKEDRLLIP